MRLTFEGRVHLGFVSAFALSALLLGEDLVLLLGATGLATILAARFAALANLRGLEVERVVPPRGRVGVPLRLTYRIASARRTLAVGLAVQDRLGGSARPARLELDVAALPPGDHALQHVEPVTFARRGRVRLFGPTLGTRWPLGLFRAWRTAPVVHEVLVRPREGRPTPLLRERLAGWLRAERHPSLRHLGDDVFHGVREYREGDDPRRIHWRTTARRGALTVAEWHREEGRDLVVVLGRGPMAGPGGAADFERAVSVAATVLTVAARHGLDARLLLGRPGEVARAAGCTTRAANMDALALVKPQAGRRPRAVLRALAGRGGRRVVVYVASTDEPGIARRLEDAAGRGGSGVLLRADRPDIARWVRGLP